ncbi:acyltransferase [Pelomonas sp. KK5]|uniref:acyltransferase family protein n=1 Tax=Pelomonas sp. KK5 TaxID=1855730 RepID=UPI00097BD86D|nr:acyltransferase [Pelomonas sp. KK5]
MKELKGLTSLRGIAALAVVMQHFSTTAQEHCDATIPSLVPHGYMAVDFFFVLSGYIMCYTYLASFESGPWAASYGSFLKKRVIRLFPLNVFVVLSLVLCGFASSALLGRNIFFGALSYPFDLLCNLLMLQGLGIGRNINGPSWSVSVEFVAYILFPLLSACAFARRRWLTTATLIVAVGGLVSVAAGLPRLALAADDPLGGGARCLTEFTLGMFAYRAAQSSGRATAWLSSDRAAFGGLAACIALLLLRVDLLVALSFPFVVLTIALNEGRAQRVFSRPLPYMLGTVSYSLYLIHNAFRPAELALVQYLHPERLSRAEALGFAFVGSLSVIPFAWLTYHCIELPAREFLRRKLARREGRGLGQQA